jgi:hypothetical protein
VVSRFQRSAARAATVPLARCNGSRRGLRKFRWRCHPSLARTELVSTRGNNLGFEVGLSAAIAETKVANVISIDYSDVVIDKMAVKYKGKPNMQFMKMDATRLDLRNNSIDLVVDKGTMDSILVRFGARCSIARR